MGIGGYITIIRMAAKFMRAYSAAVKVEQERDGDVSWLDYLTCILEALQTMDEEDLTTILKVAKKAGSKKKP